MNMCKDNKKCPVIKYGEDKEDLYDSYCIYYKHDHMTLFEMVVSDCWVIRALASSFRRYGILIDNEIPNWTRTCVAVTYCVSEAICECVFNPDKVSMHTDF